MRRADFSMHCVRWAIAAAVWLMAAAAGMAQPVPRSVLILDESAGAAAGQFYANIISALRGSVNRDPLKRASIFVEHLDLSRFRGPAYDQNLRTFLEAKYSATPIGAVVAIGDGALNYLLRVPSELWTRTPVVFTMVDTGVARALELTPNITGTTFRLSFSLLVDAARAVVPDLAGIAIVGDRFGDLVPYRHFGDELPAIAASGLQIVDLTGQPLREVTKRVAQLPERTVIIYTVMYSDGEGTYLAPLEALQRFAPAANRPIIVTTETQIGIGGTGGFVVDSRSLGTNAAALVLRVLDGESVSNIRVAQGDAVKPVFDWRELQRWGVSATQLPPNSDIRFYRPSAWDLYRWQIIAIAAAILFQAVLIQWLLSERRRRQRSEAVTRNTLSELAQVNRLATGKELTASIAHEVMQPLTGIVSSANAGLRWLSAENPDVDKARALLSQIVTAGHRTADVVRAIRAAFKQTLDHSGAVQMNGLIVEVLDLVKNDLAEHRVSIELHLDDKLSPITCDRVQLQQVLINLVLNAIDAMNAVQSGTKMLDITTRADVDGVMVSVEDDGPGVSPEGLQQIFKPLFSTKTQGMGLGLSICRSIIEAHHGRIWASHREPQGLTVAFALPLKQPEA